MKKKNSGCFYTGHCILNGAESWAFQLDNNALCSLLEFCETQSLCVALAVHCPRHCDVAQAGLKFRKTSLYFQSAGIKCVQYHIRKKIDFYRAF